MILAIIEASIFAFMKSPAVPDTPRRLSASKSIFFDKSKFPAVAFKIKFAKIGLMIWD